MAIVLDGTLGLTYTGDTAASNNLAVPGNVGVGTSSPEAKLDVRGSSTFLVNATNPTAWVSVNSTLTTGSIYSQWNTSTNEGIFGSYTNHPIYFVTNNTRRLTIDTSGNVLVGRTSAGGLQSGNLSNNIQVSDNIANGSYTIGGFGSFLGRQASDGSTILNTGQGNIIFSGGAYGSTTTWATFTSSGNIGIGTTTPGTGTGITFPATQSASTNVNTLDDYEEGTWTPNINSNNGTGTFATKVGSYVKIGKQVTIWFVVDGGNSLAAGTTQYLAGLPFNIGSLQTNTIMGHMGSNGPATRTQQLMTLSGNRAVMYIYIGGSQETTTISFGAGCATYWID